jgi:DNA-binding CsgD family transcriptional regulator
LSYKKTTPDGNNSFFPLQNAFLIYRPKGEHRTEEVFYSQEASQVLSRSLQSFGKEKLSPDKLCSLCSQWKRLLDKSAAEKEEMNKPVYILDTLKSDRRLYAIKGLRLSNHHHMQEGIENRFIFILERMHVDKINLSLIARHFKLNKREQDIVRLLIEERNNTDIAHLLGLSLNTIKSYMKILMRKLGVTSRAGIITCLLMKR